ncbi:major head protein [Microbacterium phage Min1]|uniref:Uncharacterized protein n=1 Tax=Microbacterium phage Min1 TaxID=446529 RepID=A6N1Z9_9CAUD|nr:major head protein [Microbacterium phage Min1]ABR10471.1 hypothetical protein [Microbacterium phage Min1]
MGYTYPQRHKEGALTAEELQLLLKSKTLIGRRLADLTKEKFLADYLLSGRYDATGGGVFYETETEDLYTDEDPEAIEPGGEYPLITLDEGVPSAARAVKWGQGIIFTDEKVTREGRQYVEKGLRRIGNTIVRHTDPVGMGRHLVPGDQHARRLGKLDLRRRDHAGHPHDPEPARRTRHRLGARRRRALRRAVREADRDPRR